MSDRVKLISFKAPIVLYNQIKSNALAEGISVSAYLRKSIEMRLDPGMADGNTESDQSITAFVEQLQTKDTQIAQLHDQIQELHQLIAMGHKERDRLSEQLQHTTIQLEDLRQPNPAWWKRMFGTR